MENSDKHKIITFNPLVENANIHRSNTLVLLLLYSIVVLFLYNFKILFYIALILVIPMICWLVIQQKIFKDNLNMWKVPNKTPKAITINLESNFIDINGLEIPIKSIESVKINYNRPPEMKGITKYFILMYFINCSLELQLNGGKIVQMPLHSRNDIKRIVNILVSLDVKASFDQHVYRLCGIN